MTDDRDVALGRALAENEALRIYGAILENAWAVHWIVDATGVVRYTSPTRTAMGLPAFVPDGVKTVFEVLPPEQRGRARAALAEAVASSPTRPVFLELRGVSNGTWAEREVVLLNRLDHPVLRGVLITSIDVGPRNATRYALRVAYERHALAAEASKGHVWELDAKDEGSALPAFVAIHHDVDPRHPEAALEHVHPTDRAALREALRAQLAGSPMDLEWRLVRPERGPRWHRTVALVMVDDRGQRIVGTTNDIHERKVAELALVDSERRYRSLFESTSTAVTLRDVETAAFLDCNDAAVRIFGARTREELRATKPYDLAPALQPDGRSSIDLHRAAVAQAKRDGSARLEWVGRRLTGELFDAEFIISKIDLQDGSSVFQTLIDDVTERRRSVDALRRRAARDELLHAVSRRLLDDDYDAAVADVLAPLGGILSAAWVALYAAGEGHELVRSAAWTRTAATVPPPHVLEIADDDPRGPVRSASVGYGNRRVARLAIGAPEGASWQRDDVALLEAVAELLGVARARREAEASLARAKEDALAAARAKAAFLATMSHELRSPLNGVIGMVDLLATGSLDARQKRYVEIARASARGLLSVINDVLDFSKIEAGKLELASVDLSFQDVLDEATCLFALSAEEKRVGLVCSGDVLPRLVGDPARLRQILVNLVGNAVKFTSQGEIRVRATAVESTESAVRIRVEVSDTGIGIAASDVGKIFRPFASLEEPSHSRHGGTGLGLAICRELVERMGGTIGVESALGAGSRFWFELQLTRARFDSVQPALASADASRVLVVAGRESVRSALASALEARGYRVDAAASAETAHARLAQDRHPLVIVVDEPTALDARVVASRFGSDARLRETRVVFVESLRRPLEDDEARRLRIAARCPTPVWNARLEAIVAGVLHHDATSIAPRAAATAEAAHVLVVDDSEVNLEVAAEVLRSAGYRVDVARDGEEAIDRVSRHSYDAVLLDCVLPGIDGYETARRIRTLEHEGKLLAGRPIPIVALTATAMSGDRERALEAGMNDHVAKPFEASHLLRVVASHVRAARRAAGTGDWDRSRTTKRLDMTRALARLGGDGEVLGRAVRRFVALAPETFALLAAGVTRRDRRAVGFAAHRLRGQAATFDANALVEAVEALESAVAAADWPSADATLGRASHELDAVLRELADGESSAPRAT